MTIRCNKTTWYSRAGGSPQGRKGLEGGPLSSPHWKRCGCGPWMAVKLAGLPGPWISSPGKQEATLWGTSQVQASQLMDQQR